MKRLLPQLAFAALLLPASQGLAANVYVDPASAWGGFMNVYDLGAGQTQGGYLWGSGWATTDLPAGFTATALTLSPNVSTWNPADSYWVASGQPNKWMEANYYVDVGTSFAGSPVTFMGDTLSSSLVAPYTALAFIKEFTPGYGWVGMDSAPLVAGNSFSVSRTIGAGNIAQYGFILQGPNADPATVSALGTAVIAVIPEPASGALLALGLLGIWAGRRARA